MRVRWANVVPGLRAWVWRHTLIPRWRRKFGAVTIRRAYVTLYAIGCSQEEADELDGIDPALVTKVAEVVRAWLGVSVPIPCVRVLCVGSGAPPDCLPLSVRQMLGDGELAGAWMRGIGMAIVTFRSKVGPLHTLVHELTHALVDLFTDGFPYPRAINEGFAGYVVRSVGERARPRHIEAFRWNGGGNEKSTGGGLPLLSVHKLFTSYPKEHQAPDRDASTMFPWASFWLFAYIVERTASHPVLLGILSKLRRNDIREPEAVYRWLQNALGMKAEELEDDFLGYCRFNVPRTYSCDYLPLPGM